MELEINGKKYNGTITEVTLYKENNFDGISKLLPYVHKYELNEELYDDIPEICIVNNRQCYKGPRDNGKFRLIEIIKDGSYIKPHLTNQDKMIENAKGRGVNKKMDLRELFEKVYYGKIKEEDVIVQHTKEYGEEYDRYILNDGFDFWFYNGDGVLSLNFFKNDFDENYNATYSIISKEEYEKRLEEAHRRNRIKELEAELEKLKVEENE